MDSRTAVHSCHEKGCSTCPIFEFRAAQRSRSVSLKVRFCGRFRRPRVRSSAPASSLEPGPGAFFSSGPGESRPTLKKKTGPSPSCERAINKRGITFNYTRIYVLYNTSSKMANTQRKIPGSARTAEYTHQMNETRPLICD